MENSPVTEDNLASVWNAIQSVLSDVQAAFLDTWRQVYKVFLAYTIAARRIVLYNRLRRRIPEQGARFVAERCPVFLLPRFKLADFLQPGGHTITDDVRKDAEAANADGQE